MSAEAQKLPPEYLREALMARIARNQAYSLRALARDLGLSHTYLSLVLNGKKGISARQAQWLGERLGFDEPTATAFVRSTLYAPRPVTKNAPAKVVEFAHLDADRLRVLRDWYHFAILDLTLVEGFRPDPRWIAKRLGVTPLQIREAADRLERLGLLERGESGWKKTNAFLQIPTNRTTAPMRRFHREMIGKALTALQSSKPEDFAARDVTGSMIPLNPARLPEAKRRIARFRRQLLQFLSEGECTELYQLNVQLFRLTKSENGGRP